jgi:hypothetical protein
VEIMEAGKAGGLSPQELETHARAELLPDRIEMHRRVRKLRKRVRRGNVICGGDNNTCNRINT